MLYYCLVLLCFHARLFVDTLWSSAGKGLTYWLSFVMSTCDVVTFPLVSWVRYGAWLYGFLIFTLFLIYIACLIIYEKVTLNTFLYSNLMAIMCDNCFTICKWMFIPFNTTYLEKAWANSVDPDEVAQMSHLIWIYTVYLFILLFLSFSICAGIF